MPTHDENNLLDDLDAFVDRIDRPRPARGPSRLLLALSVTTVASWGTALTQWLDGIS